MDCYTSYWLDKSATGAGTTVVENAWPQNKGRRYCKGLIVDVSGLGSGEYTKIRVDGNPSTAFYTRSNGFHTVDYATLSGQMGGRDIGPASTKLEIVQTGASTFTQVSYGGFYTT